MTWHCPDTSRGGHDEAILTSYQVISRHPCRALGYSSRGSAWSHKKEYDKAIADFNEAIRLDPKFTYAYYNRGQRLVAKKEYDKAIADFDEGDPARPQVPTAYNMPGQRLVSRRRSTTRRSPTSTRRSGSTPSWPWRTPTGADAWTRRRSTTRRSPTTTRRSELDPKLAAGVQRPRRLDCQEGVRQGHRRLRQGDPTRPQGRPAYDDRGRPGLRRRSTTRPSPTTTRRSGSIPRTP